MKFKTRSNIILIITIIATVLAIASPFIAGNINRQLSGTPEIINGKGDFTNTKSDYTLYLTGEWEYYDGIHIISNREQVAPTISKIPTPIVEPITSLSKANGFTASYKITVSNLQYENAIIYVPHFAGIYNVFVNGIKVTQSGTYIDQKAHANLDLIASNVKFEPQNTYEIVIEATCNMMPSLYMTPVISNIDYTMTYSKIAQTFRSLLTGVVLFCGLFIFAFSVKRSFILSSKWLPVLCACVAVRMMISTEGYSVFSFLFPYIDYESITLIICVSTFIIKLVALLFYSETLDLKIDKKVIAVFCFVFLALSLVAGVLPYIIFSPYYYIIIQAATIPLDIIILSNICNCVVRKLPYAKLYLTGYITILLGTLVDCFYTNGVISFMSSQFMPICFTIFIITFVVIYFEKISKIFNTALKTAEVEKELEIANTSLMISQIQPHFLYNALNTIKYLIKRDPKSAEKAVISFSKYLRGNMDSITQKAPIPFTDELEHTKHYCDIELLRFGDKLNIVYDTPVTNFVIPALSVQPLVENAIKHGVTKKIEGGTVTVITNEDENNYIIKIQDDGVGFDVQNPDLKPSEAHAHIGVNNVRERLINMINAEFIIESQIDVGTCVTIKIPKKEIESV
ncbi:MAG: histidine kinase [Clostridia bacterium]|nr:histidine kinase [Clostridia bacterium]